MKKIWISGSRGPGTPNGEFEDLQWIIWVCRSGENRSQRFWWGLDVNHITVLDLRFDRFFWHTQDLILDVAIANAGSAAQEWLWWPASRGEVEEPSGGAWFFLLGSAIRGWCLLPCPALGYGSRFEFLKTDWQRICHPYWIANHPISRYPSGPLNLNLEMVAFQCLSSKICFCLTSCLRIPRWPEEG